MILEGMIKTLKSANPEAKITVMSANPEETAKTHNVEAIYKFPAGIRSFFKFLFKHRSETKKALKNCDCFVLGGGGLFTNLTKRAYFIWAIQARKAIRYKKPVIMYGQSVGPVEGVIRKRIVKKLFNKAVFIAVRDEESKEELKNLGVKGKINLIPDLIFCLDDEKIKEAKIPTGKEKKKNVIVSLRQLNDIPPAFKRELTDFLNLLIEEKKCHIEFANFQIPDDEILTAKIIEGIRRKENVSILPEFKKASEVLKVFAEADFVLGMRLHSVLTAIKARTPFIAISYAPKVKNFLEYAKLKDFVVDIDIADLKEKYDEFEASELTKMRAHGASAQRDEESGSASSEASELTKRTNRLENFNQRAQSRQKEIVKELRSFLQNL